MTDLSYRLDDFGRRLATLEEELDELRRVARREEVSGAPQVGWKPLTPPPAPPRATRPAAVPAPKPARARREIDWSALFGAKALAWAGGAVTLLGIVFFFVLAVNRGWIGPVARVTLGGLASVLVFGAARVSVALHYPSDIVGSALLAGLLAGGALRLTGWAQRRRLPP